MWATLNILKSFHMNKDIGLSNKKFGSYKVFNYCINVCIARQRVDSVLFANVKNDWLY